MQQFFYTVIPSSRRTLSLQVRTDGSIVVRCPRHCPRSEIQKFVDSKSHWIEENLRKLQQLHSLPSLTQQELELLRKEAKDYIPSRAAVYAPLVGVDYGKITIRCQKTRWGSCSSQGNLNFNLLLMLAPPEVLDYVVVHELCHRREMNHSRRFWALVEQVLPDYRLRKQWLKEQGGSILGRAI